MWDSEKLLILAIEVKTKDHTGRGDTRKRTMAGGDAASHDKEAEKGHNGEYKNHIELLI